MWLRIYLAIKKLFVKLKNKKNHFAVPKDNRLNPTHYFIMKTPNKWDLQQIVFSDS